jgi:hypothetical protein
LQKCGFFFLDIVFYFQPCDFTFGFNSHVDFCYLMNWTQINIFKNHRVKSFKHKIKLQEQGFMSVDFCQNANFELFFA